MAGCGALKRVWGVKDMGGAGNGLVMLAAQKMSSLARIDAAEAAMTLARAFTSRR